MGLRQIITNVIPDKWKEPLKNQFRNFKLLLKSEGLRPTFFVAGIRKGGTTSLYNYLIQHPQIVPALEKEIHYFDLYFDRSEKWYLSNFNSAKKNAGKITGEATPQYQYNPLVPERIKKFNPDARIIFVLRHPLKRAFSDYEYDVKHGANRAKITFNDRINFEFDYIEINKSEIFDQNNLPLLHHVKKAPLLLRGLYFRHIQLWLSHFDQKNLLFIQSEEMFADPQKTMNHCCRFLQLKEVKLRNEEAANKNVYKKIQSDPETEKRISAFFSQYHSALEEICQRKFSWDY